MSTIKSTNPQMKAVALVAVALAALLALSAIGAGAASAAAPRWKVNGSYLAAGQTKSITGTSEGVSKFSFFPVEMPNCSLKGGLIEGTGAGVPGKIKKARLECTGGYVPNTVCVVQQEGPIVTQNLKGNLVWTSKTESGPAGLVLEPESGLSLGVLSIDDCGYAGSYTEMGQLGAALPSGTESASGALSFAGGLKYWSGGVERVTDLKFNTTHIAFTSSMRTVLGTGEKFGVYPG